MMGRFIDSQTRFSLAEKRIDLQVGSVNYIEQPSNRLIKFLVRRHRRRKQRNGKADCEKKACQKVAGRPRIRFVSRGQVNSVNRLTAHFDGVILLLGSDGHHQRRVRHAGKAFWNRTIFETL